MGCVAADLRHRPRLRDQQMRTSGRARRSDVVRRQHAFMDTRGSVGRGRKAAICSAEVRLGLRVGQLFVNDPERQRGMITALRQ